EILQSLVRHRACSCRLCHGQSPHLRHCRIGLRRIDRQRVLRTVGKPYQPRLDRRARRRSDIRPALVGQGRVALSQSRRSPVRGDRGEQWARSQSGAARTQLSVLVGNDRADHMANDAISVLNQRFKISFTTLFSAQPFANYNRDGGEKFLPHCRHNFSNVCVFSTLATNRRCRLCTCPTTAWRRRAWRSKMKRIVFALVPLAATTVTATAADLARRGPV